MCRRWGSSGCPTRPAARGKTRPRTHSRTRTWRRPGCGAGWQQGWRAVSRWRGSGGGARRRASPCAARWAGALHQPSYPPTHPCALSSCHSPSYSFPFVNVMRPRPSRLPYLRGRGVGRLGCRWGAAAAVIPLRPQAGQPAQRRHGPQRTATAPRSGRRWSRCARPGRATGCPASRPAQQADAATAELRHAAVHDPGLQAQPSPSPSSPAAAPPTVYVSPLVKCWVCSRTVKSSGV